MFSPGICWSGLSLKHAGPLTHRVQTNSQGVRAFSVMCLRLKLYAVMT